MDRSNAKCMSCRLIFLLALISSSPVFAEEIIDPSRTATTTSPRQELQADDDAVLQRHYPFYFAYGKPLSKLQLSFKSPVIRKFPLYFGYTQVMFWALEEDSKPFRDLSYNPELFYRWQGDWRLLNSIDFGIWGHTSNGKKDEDSRSYNKQYVRFNFEREGRRWMTRMSVQLQNLHGFDPTNKDIQDYVSPLAFDITFIQMFDSWVDKTEVTLTAIPGGKFADRWERGGYQLSTSFRFGKLVVPAFYLQYYHGYSETLLNYNQEVREFRAGFVF